MEDINSFYNKIHSIQKKSKNINLQSLHESKIKFSLLNKSIDEIQEYGEIFLRKKTYDNINSGIVYILEKDNEKYFSEKIRWQMTFMYNYIKSNPELLLKILKICLTENSIKTISNFVQNNFYNNPFSNKSIEDDYLFLITVQLFSDLKTSNIPEHFAEKLSNQSLSGCLLNAIYDNFDVATFISNLFEKSFNILKYMQRKDYLLIFDIPKLVENCNQITEEQKKDSNDRMNNNESSNSNNNNGLYNHNHCIQKMFSFKPIENYDKLNETDIFFLRKELEANYEYIDIENIKNTEVEDKEGVFKQNIQNELSQYLYQGIQNKNMKTYLNLLLSQCKSNEDIFSNTAFNNNTHYSKIKKNHLKNSLIIITIIDSIIDYLYNNIDLIPISIKYICTIISILIKIKHNSGELITEIEENKYIKVFFIDKIINFTLDNPFQAFLLNKGDLNENLISNCREVKIIINKLFNFELFQGDTHPQYTFFNNYFLKITPKILAIYSSIKSSVILPQFIKNYISRLNDTHEKEEEKQVLCFNKNNLDKKVLNKYSFLVSFEDIKLFVGKINELNSSGEIQSNHKSLLNAVAVIEKEINQIELFDSQDKLKRIFRYFIFYTPNMRNFKSIQNIPSNETSLKDNDNINDEFKTCFKNILEQLSILPIEIFHYYKINSIETLINSLEKILLVPSCKLSFSDEPNLLIDIIVDLYNGYTQEQKQKIENDLLTEIQCEISDWFFKNNYGNVVDTQELMQIIKGKISEMQILVNAGEDYLISMLTKMIIEKLKINLSIKSKGIFSSKYVFIVEECSPHSKSSKYNQVSNNIVGFCNEILAYPIKKLIKDLKYEEYFIQYSKEQIPLVLQNVFELIKKKILNLNIAEFYYKNMSYPFPQFTNLKIKQIQNLVVLKTLNYIYDMIFNFVFPPVQLQSDNHIHKITTYLRKLMPEHCGFFLNTTQHCLIKKAINLFMHKFNKAKGLYEMFSLIYKVIKYLEEVGGVHDIMMYRLLFFLLAKSRPQRLHSMIEYIKVYFFEMSSKEKEIFDMLNNSMKCIEKIDIEKLQGISKQDEFDVVISSLIVFHESDDE